jgi:equilibrative nucleoside transporter 1/2/3
MFLIYALTLSIFPGFLSEDTGTHSLGTWYVPLLPALYQIFGTFIILFYFKHFFVFYESKRQRLKQIEFHFCRYALVLIAMYNVWDLIGRYIPLLEFLKLESRKLITVVILCRFLLVPAFYFTAKYGDQGWMILLTSFLGLSNGYLTVCVMTSAPKGYKVSLYYCV